MKTISLFSPVSRRKFVALSSASAASLIAGSSLRCKNQKQPPNSNDTVQDHLWIWTHPAGAHNGRWGNPGWSRMTPVEGALYLDLPNLLFIRFQGGLPPLNEYRKYAISFRPMKRVVWSLVGATGASGEEDRTLPLQLAEQFPNITGFIMDDFFKPDGSGSLSLVQVKTLADRMVIGGHQHDLYVVVYSDLLDRPIEPYLQYCNKITYWTWDAKDLVNLERDFKRLEKKAPHHGLLLGYYMFDNGGGKPMPVEVMARQLELGLRWLHEKRIEGMIFMASNICDMELEAVEYTRKWIAENKNQLV